MHTTSNLQNLIKKKKEEGEVFTHEVPQDEDEWPE